jgi:hypothetical protein
MVIPHHTFSNHNGGDLVMGPEGLLYISVGDGGGGGDTLHNGQNLDRRSGRSCASTRSETARRSTRSSDNPFARQPGRRGEIWMYGLRNPWRFSFDRKTHDIWIGDVGQGNFEEIDYAPARRGINWGGTCARASTRTAAAPVRRRARPDLRTVPRGRRLRDHRRLRVTASPNVPLVGAYVFGRVHRRDPRARAATVTSSRSAGLHLQRAAARPSVRAPAVRLLRSRSAARSTGSTASQRSPEARTVTR